MYFIRLVKEIFNWIEVYSIIKRNEEELLKLGLRVDWIGRLYTIINLPEEIATNEHARHPYIITQLRKYDVVLLKFGLTELVYPDIEVIENSYSYLLVLRPEREELYFMPFIKNLVLYIFIFIILKIVYSLLIHNTEISTYIYNFINTHIL